MGQYYMPTLISEDGKIETLYSHDFDSGLKLMEHSWIGNEFVNAALSLIYKAPKKVAWIGDYSNDPYDGAEHYTVGQSLDDFLVCYEAAWENDNLRLKQEAFSLEALDILTYDTKQAYLVNRSLGEYLDIVKYIQECKTNDGDYDWCVNPLPLLTACGNDRGGGDFHSNGKGFDLVGLWAFDKLEFTDESPEGLTEVAYRFAEAA